MKFTSKEQLALFTVKEYSASGKIPRVEKTDVPKDWLRDAACFVTLFVDGQLHGCIGNAEAVGPLYTSIITNALAAAFEDFRFPTLTKEELPRLTADVSVLSPLRAYKPESPEKLITMLTHDKPGLVIEKDGEKALFLPQVWDELPEPNDFLARLCMKAGLNPDAWKSPHTRFFIFSKE